jgi:hypothetical protein
VEPATLFAATILTALKDVGTRQSLGRGILFALAPEYMAVGAAILGMHWRLGHFFTNLLDDLSYHVPISH